MDKKANDEVVKVISAVGGLIVAVTPIVEKIINKGANGSPEENNNVIIPLLYQKGFPINLEQGKTLLIEQGLKVSTSKLRINKADPRYKDFEDTQIIGSSPKQGTKVKSGTTVCLRYITQDVIDASQKIFDDNVKWKLEIKEQKINKRIERNEKIKEHAVRPLNIVKKNVRKIFEKRNNSEKD